MITWKTSIFILTILIFANTQLIGIDFGTQFIKVGMIHSGAGKSFTIVQSSKSQRKIQSAISFFNDDRFYESEAVNKRLRSTKNTFLYTKLFIQYMNNRTQLIEIQKNFFLNHQIVNQETTDMFNFLLDNFLIGEKQEKVTLSLEQVFAMIFRYIKRLSQKHGNTKVRDCVITVPNYWTLDQRILLTNALTIADLYPLSIINENTAAAIQYAINRNDTNTHRAAFYNLGAHSLQFSIVQFRLTNDSRTKKPVESVFVIAQFGVPRVGGLEFDLVLANHFQNVFQQKYKKKLNTKAKIKLLQQATQVKQVLSANKDSQVMVEELFQGIDFQTKITRGQFQKLSSNLLQKLTDPIVPFLKKNQLKTSDIHNVQLIGGSIRIPKLQSRLNEIFVGAEVGIHLNGDESMALGSTFYAANSSKKFKVKGMHLYDGFNFEIRLVLKNLQSGIDEFDDEYFFKNITLFKKKNRFGLIKQVNFKCKQNLIAQFWKQDNNGLQLIKTVKLTNVTNYKNTQKFAKLVPKISLSIQTDPLQIVIISQAKVTIVADQTVSYVQQVKKQKKKSKKKKVNKTESQQSKNDKNETTTEQSPIVQSNLNQTISNQLNETIKNKTKTKKQNKTQEQSYEYETVQKTKNVQKTYNLKIVKHQNWNLRQRISGQKLEQAQKILKKFDEDEQFKKKLAQAKNRLEAIVYEAKQLLQNKQFLPYSTQSEIQTIKQQIQQKQQVMYDKNNHQGYTKLYKQVNQPISKIKNRMVQHRQRQGVKKNVYSSISQYEKKLQKLSKQNSWLTQQQKQPLTTQIDKIKNELNNIYKKLQQQKINQDPHTQNKKILKKIDNMKDLYYTLKNIPKPKAKKQKQQKEEKKNQDKAKQQKLQL